MSEVGVLGPGRIEPRELEQEMRSSYLDYAMSVIVGRALPDVRDGLKPVHRRVLYSMHENGLQPNRPYKKSANVVGAVMGNYHPHGDSAIYDTLVRMAQPFSLRYPLVDGQGNFGSIDDDSAAAMRYTECRLARIATEMLRDIDADTVDYVPNYDESRREPLTVPSRFPNLLVNGSAGIAVGMATNIPPHRLTEVIDAIVQLIDNPDSNVDDLMKHVKGPDFPTGAYIIGRSGIRDAYRTGRGRVVMRARAHIEELRGGKSAIIVTELPYGVKKGGENGVITKIADLVNDKVLSEISDLQDHSDRTGMRIQIELKRDAIPNVALNKLFKHTQLQTTFGYNAVALVDGVPRTLSLLELVHEYLRYQRSVVTRRSKHELRKAEERAHVLQGYLIALDNLDEVIALIRGSADTDSARTGLMERFGLSEIQAQAILDLRLARLTGLARKEIEDEFADLQERIAELRAILGDPARIDALIREELLEIKEIYGKTDDRRTEIAAAEEELELEDLIAEEDMVIAITRSGYVKRLPVTTYREQRRGGIGVMGMELKDEDYIEHLFVASTHDYLLFFTSVGKIYRLKVHELPLGSRQSKGRAIVNLLPFQQTETIRAVIATRDFKDAEYLTAVTKNGLVKKTRFEEYNTPLRADGIIAIKLRDGDELVGVLHSSGDDDILMVSRKGQAIRFNEKLARPMGRATSGVTGMRLRKGDEVIAADIARNDADLLVVTKNGFGKRTRIDQYPVKGRGGLGVKTVQLTEARGQLAGSLVVREGDQVMLITTGGTVIRVPADGIKQSGRSTQGVIVMRPREGELVSTLARVVEQDEDDGLEPAVELGPAARGRAGAGARARRLAAWCERSPSRGAPRAGGRHAPAPQARAHPRPGVPRGRRLTDAARLLDDEGPYPHEGQEAAPLRPRRCRDGDADQAGQGQGPLAPGRHRRHKALQGGQGAARPAAELTGRALLGLAEDAGRRLRRQRVHEVAGAELHAGQHAEAGHHLDVPVAAGVQPEVERDRALGDPDPADPLRGEDQRLRQAPARERVGLALDGSDQQLVGLPAGEGAEEDEPVALLDDAHALLSLLGEHTTDEAASGGGLGVALLGDERRVLLEPDELRVAVRQARSRRRAFVDERVDVWEPSLARGCCPGLPRLGDELQLAAAQVGDRADVPG